MEKTKKMKKWTGILILIPIVAILATFVLGKNYYKKSIGPMTKENPVEKLVVIPANSSTTRIGDILEEEGLISNKYIFKYQVKKLEADGKLKAGKFDLNTNMDMDSIIQRIVKGSKNENTVRFTIPEGYEIRQMAERLSKDGLVNKDRFLDLVNDKGNFQEDYSFLKELKEGQTLEGFLFPSTYEIFIGAKEEEIIGKMLSEFEKVYLKEIEPKLDTVDLDFNEIITLASIIEREGKLDKERPIMSGVFHNRLKDNMPLQSCATVQFILGERKEVLSTKDTQIESPYNTYLHQGLPPGPIASPGVNSLIAAINPEDVDYLFFVLTGEDGSHTFTRTYQEHKQAKPKN